MPWRGPQYKGEFPSLGWGLIDLCQQYLGVPSGPEYGKQLKLTEWQTRFLVKLYRVDPKTGRRVYRRGCKVGPKGLGKSPLLFFFLFGEFVGPVVFDGWDAAGEPVGKPQTTPWVQTAALSEDQTDNTYVQLLSALEFGDAEQDFGLDIGLTRIFRKGMRGARLEPVTASAGSREGQPVTAAGFDEPHLWVPSNGGVRLAAVIRRNVGKNNGTTLAVTNAWKRGQQSVAEADADAAKQRAAGVLFEHIEGAFVADEDMGDHGLVEAALAPVYEDSHWSPLSRLADECADPSTTPEDARRFYLNIPAPPDGAESWLPAGAWDGCESDLEIPDGAEIAIGIDMALYTDDAAVVWCSEVDDRLVVRSKVFSSKPIDPLDVMACVRELAGRYKVKGGEYDPKFFLREGHELADEGIPLLEQPQSPARMIPACGFAFQQIVSGRLAHDGDPVLARHVTAAARRTYEQGWTLSKQKSHQAGRHVIDACIAMVLALWEWDQCAQPSAPLFAIWA